MRKFIVNVNGTSYEVEVEEISGAPAAAVSTPASAPVAPAAPAPVPPAAAPSSGSGEAITAPMPGNIVEVKVKAGDMVQSGDVLVILEAMKMENEIVAAKAGRILSVDVAKGTTVNSGDLLCRIGS